MNEGLHTMLARPAWPYTPESARDTMYLGPLFDAVRACATIHCGPEPDGSATTVMATVAVLTPETYRRLLAAEQELNELKSEVW